MKESINWKSKKDVLKSVQQDGRTLQYASENLRNDIKPSEQVQQKVKRKARSGEEKSGYHNKF